MSKYFLFIIFVLINLNKTLKIHYHYYLKNGIQTKKNKKHYKIEFPGGKISINPETGEQYCIINGEIKKFEISEKQKRIKEMSFNAGEVVSTNLETGEQYCEIKTGNLIILNKRFFNLF